MTLTDHQLLFEIGLNFLSFLNLISFSTFSTMIKININVAYMIVTRLKRPPVLNNHIRRSDICSLKAGFTVF